MKNLIIFHHHKKKLNCPKTKIKSDESPTPMASSHPFFLNKQPRRKWEKNLNFLKEVANGLSPSIECNSIKQHYQKILLKTKKYTQNRIERLG